MRITEVLRERVRVRFPFFDDGPRGVDESALLDDVEAWAWKHHRKLILAEVRYIIARMVKAVIVNEIHRGRPTARQVTHLLSASNPAQAPLPSLEEAEQQRYRDASGTLYALADMTAHKILEASRVNGLLADENRAKQRYLRGIYDAMIAAGADEATYREWRGRPAPAAAAPGP
jgi:hypothetical protein